MLSAIYREDFYRTRISIAFPIRSLDLSVRLRGFLSHSLSVRLIVIHSVDPTPQQSVLSPLPPFLHSRQRSSSDGCPALGHIAHLQVL